MRRDKKWFEGVKWAESIFKEMLFCEALDYVRNKISFRDYNAFDTGASDYCNYVQNNPEIFQYRFRDERTIDQGVLL